MVDVAMAMRRLTAVITGDGAAKLCEVGRYDRLCSDEYWWWSG